MRKSKCEHYHIGRVSMLVVLVGLMMKFLPCGYGTRLTLSLWIHSSVEVI